MNFNAGNRYHLSSGGFGEGGFLKGTLVNSGAILVGSLIGLSAGRRLPERMKKILMQALGLAVVIIGLQMALAGRGDPRGHRMPPSGRDHGGTHRC